VDIRSRFVKVDLGQIKQEFFGSQRQVPVVSKKIIGDHAAISSPNLLPFRPAGFGVSRTFAMIGLLQLSVWFGHWFNRSFLEKSPMRVLRFAENKKFWRETPLAPCHIARGFVNLTTSRPAEKVERRFRSASTTHPLIWRFFCSDSRVDFDKC
jgi:hypothetical protein